MILFDDIQKYVVDAGKAAGTGEHVGTVLYNRGIYAAFLAAEAAKTAQAANGTMDINAQTVTIRSARLGSYQIRMAAQLGDVSLVQVYPRIFTPNGDGANDLVIFQFGEGGLAGSGLTGEVFDIIGTKVASLQPGPDPANTLQWDGKTDTGSALPAGIYIYQIKVSGELVNGTVVLAK